MLRRVWLPPRLPRRFRLRPLMRQPAHASFPRLHTETLVIPHDEVTNFGRTIPTTVNRLERVPAHISRGAVTVLLSHIIFSSLGGWYVSECVWETWEGASMRLEQSCFILEQNCKEKDLCKVFGFKRSKCRATEIFLKRELDHTWHSRNNTTASTCWPPCCHSCACMWKLEICDGLLWRHILTKLLSQLDPFNSCCYVWLHSESNFKTSHNLFI